MTRARTKRERKRTHLVLIGAWSLEEPAVLPHDALHVVASELREGGGGVHDGVVRSRGVGDAERPLLQLELVDEVAVVAAHDLMHHLTDVLRQLHSAAAHDLAQHRRGEVLLRQQLEALVLVEHSHHRVSEGLHLGLLFHAGLPGQHLVPLPVKQIACEIQIYTAAYNTTSFDP